MYIIKRDFLVTEWICENIRIMFFHLLSAPFLDLLAETMFGVKSHDQSAFSCSLPELLHHSFSC